MKKKKILISIIVILLLVEAVSLYLLYKPNNKNKVLEDIKTIDVFKEKDKSLAIMVQNEGENDFGWHEAEDRTKWPDKTKYTYVGTECTDSEGVKIPTTSVLTFDETTYTAHIKTKQTIYCTLYFAKGRPVLEVLKAKGGDYYAGGGQHTTAVDGLYRFKGTKAQITNNYICLGDENPDVCKTNTDNMYRIIGVTTEGNLKVIKAKKYGANQKWHSSSSSDTRWNASTLYTYLNGTFYNSVNARIKGLIEKHTWNMEKRTSTPGATTGKEDGTVSANIGLMYGSDYVNAYQNSSTDNWLFIQNGLTGNTAENEWTMSRYGADTYGYYIAWYVTTSGSLGRFSGRVDFTYAVRPVFYLTNEIGLVGEGTETNPFIITSKANA